MLPSTRRFARGATPRRHRWLCLAVPLVASALTGCRCSDPPEAETKAAAGGEVAIERGDEVLVEPTSGEFFEGRVLALENSGGTPSLKLQRSDGEITNADAADVYRLQRGGEGFAASRGQHGASLGPGKLAVCEVAQQAWVGCRVKAAIDSGYRVEDYAGEEHQVTAGKIVVPSELTRMNLEQRFKVGDRRRNFDRDARRAGQPSAPSGFSPGFKARVIAKRGDEWFTAHIVRFHDDGAFRVRWADDRENDVAKAQVIPEPPYPAPPKRGGFVLVKPNVPSMPWARKRVISVRPELVLEDSAGEQATSSLREVVPLDADLPEPKEEITP